MSDEEIECPDCNGHGEVCGVRPNRRSRFVSMDDLSPGDFTLPCEACGGRGWRAMTEDEETDAAEEQFRLMMEGEAPLSMQDAYKQAFQQKQGLR